MTIPIQPPPMDPWDPGVSADEVPVAHEPLAPNAAEIRQFLREHIGNGIHLVSIAPDGDDAAISGKYFGSDADAATQWAVAKNKSGNGLYFTVNVTTLGLNKKPTKKEIVAARFSHSDIDPPKGGASLDRSAIMSRLMQRTPPSLVIDSGNGLQPLWRLDHAPTDYGPVEDINRSVADSFGGDNCHNVDRLLRVPGTVNYPNAKKLAAGRVATMATLAHIGSGDAIYSLAELARAFPPRRAEKAKEEPREESKGDIKLLTPDDLGLSQLSPLHSVIEHPTGQDRSKDGIRAAGDLLRAGFTKLQVLGILLNPKNKVSAHYLEQTDPRRAALRVIQWLEENKSDDAGSQSSGAANDKPKKAGLLIKSSKDFVAGFVPPEYVLVGVIQRRFLYALTGQTGSGKTAVTLRLAASVARAMDFAGCQTKKCRVLYCAAENPDDVRMRWIALAPHMGFDVDDIDVFFTEGTFSISQMSDKLRSEVDRLGGEFGLVIVDTGPAFFEGDDENNRSQMGAHARKFRTLIETIPGGPSVIVNGHPVKNAGADNLLPAGGGTYLNEIDGNLTCAKNDSLTEMHWQGKFRGPEFSPMSFLIDRHSSCPQGFRREIDPLGHLRIRIRHSGGRDAGRGSQGRGPGARHSGREA